MIFPDSNVTRVAENAGAVVIGVRGLAPEIKAVFLATRRPLIALNGEGRSACRERFGIARKPEGDVGAFRRTAICSCTRDASATGATANAAGVATVRTDGQRRKLAAFGQLSVKRRFEMSGAAEHYQGYADLADLIEGTDHRVHLRPVAHSSVAVIAPHGGHRAVTSGWKSTVSTNVPREGPRSSSCRLKLRVGEIS